MPVLNIEKYQDVTQSLDELETTISMIEAFNAMMNFTIASGEDVRNFSCGMTDLLKQQCEDLRFISAAMRSQFTNLRESKLEIKDIALIAQWAGTSSKMAANIIAIATGIQLSELNEQEYQDFVKDAQQVSIMLAMKSSADIETIALETGESADTVGRILNEAYLYNPRRMKNKLKRRAAVDAGYKAHAFNEAFGHDVVTSVAVEASI